MKKIIIKFRKAIVALINIQKLMTFDSVIKFIFFSTCKKSTHSTNSFRIRPLGNKKLYIRIGTVDYLTLKTTLIDKYHRPHIHLSENPIILDLGCNVGYTILDFAYLYPNAKIIGVEMDCENFKLAQLNTLKNSNISLFNEAISTKNGFVSYSKSRHEDAYQISHNLINNNNNEVKIASITIDSLIERLNINRIDYLKMDIEGEEVNIFNNSKNLVWLQKINILNIEIHTNENDTNKILSILENNNFLAWKDNHHWSCVRAINNAIKEIM